MENPDLLWKGHIFTSGKEQHIASYGDYHLMATSLNAQTRVWKLPTCKVYSTHQTNSRNNGGLLWKATLGFFASRPLLYLGQMSWRAFKYSVYMVVCWGFWKLEIHLTMRSTLWRGFFFSQVGKTAQREIGQSSCDVNLTNSTKKKDGSFQCGKYILSYTSSQGPFHWQRLCVHGIFSEGLTTLQSPQNKFCFMKKLFLEWKCLLVPSGEQLHIASHGHLHLMATSHSPHTKGWKIQTSKLYSTPWTNPSPKSSLLWEATLAFFPT